LADKLRRAATGLRPPWDATAVTLSAGIVEAVARPDFDSEDIVNGFDQRAEFSLEEARKKGDTRWRWRARRFEESSVLSFQSSGKTQLRRQTE